MEESKYSYSDDVSIVLGGEAGQGIKTVEHMLVRILKRAGYNVFATKEYMSRVRGGSNSTQIRVASKRVAAFENRIDMLIPLDKDAISRLDKRISDDTVIIGEKENLETDREVLDTPFTSLASDIGNKLYANTVAAGVVAGIFSVEKDIIHAYLKKRFANKDEKVIEGNIKAAEKGYELGNDLIQSGKIAISVEKQDGIKEEILLNGAEAISFGAIAGGCDFVGSYPMSPSTSVLTAMAQNADDFDIIVEQAEDEICAINMTIGAWYAGLRGLVTTSGGGFALMEEGVSLAGMLETPVVIHLAQRPGPATGLPTRTEQGDLNLALYAGHGEFPRIILAPGNIEQCFQLAHKAFNLADKYQIPVIILTDQYLLDSYYNWRKLDPSSRNIEKHIVETNKDYVRYEVTDDGISPRGIPQHGNGLIIVDSDEHTTEGHITENLEFRTTIVDKRLRKFEAMKENAIIPEVIGGDDYKTLVVCWGSNYHVVKEALEQMGRDDVSMLHFTQVFPLHEDTASLLDKAKKIVMVENNATGQFANLIRVKTGIEIKERILKYNGLPFAIEEIVDQLSEIVK